MLGAPRQMRLFLHEGSGPCSSPGTPLPGACVSVPARSGAQASWSGRPPPVRQVTGHVWQHPGPTSAQWGGLTSPRGPGLTVSLGDVSPRGPLPQVPLEGAAPGRPARSPPPTAAHTLQPRALWPADWDTVLPGPCPGWTPPRVTPPWLPHSPSHRRPLGCMSPLPHVRPLLYTRTP